MGIVLWYANHAVHITMHKKWLPQFHQRTGIRRIGFVFIFLIPKCIANCHTYVMVCTNDNAENIGVLKDKGWQLIRKLLGPFITPQWGRCARLHLMVRRILEVTRKSFGREIFCHMASLLLK